MKRPGNPNDDPTASDYRPQLSQRESQVLELIAQGLSAKQVAQELSITARTVDRHIENLRNKLNARNRVHLISKAIASGELSVNIGPAMKPES